ncbi:hypothetical protein AALB39_18155 [Lachnospiraceae bacterium 54-53]
MGIVKGTIALADNATAVLQGIRKEQTAFRRDVEKTKKELKETYDKKHQAKIETAAATSKMKQLKTAMDPLRKKVVQAVAIKDMATSKLGQIGSRVKTVGKMAAAPIVKIKDATANGLSAIGGKLKSLTKNVVIPVAVAATAATTALVGGSISQGAKLEQSIGGVETLFKGDASVVKANADKAFKTAGLSANEYMESVTSFSASLLNSLGGDTAKSAEVADMAMIDMADNANKFGTDMDSIQNAYQGFAKQNYTMLDNLKLGYGGTKEEMGRLLNDASKLTGVKYDISNLSDVYNAVHAIQENLGVTGTTAKEAGETFSGSFASMKAAASNVLGNLAISGDVTGSMEQLVESASTFLFQNAVPMIGRVLTALPSAISTGISKASPKIKEAGGSIIKSLKEGMVNILPSSMGGLVDPLFDSIGSLGSSFEAVMPQLAAFGSAVMASVQRVATAAMPVIQTVITTIQQVLPAILPVLSTVISTIASVISAGAPIIGGLVSGIGTVVSALAPVFSTIFSGIGAKVSSVLDFVGSKMGGFQEIIATAMPVVASILTTAWSVISPVMDLAISVFKLLFNVTETVFKGIVKVVSSVWDKVKPIVEGVAKGLSIIKEKIGGLLGGGSSGSGGGGVGENADGTNHWKGGVTWVGEKGPELVDLPRGSRVLPNKESVRFSSQGQSTVYNAYQQPVVNQNLSVSGEAAVPLLQSINEHLRVITGKLSVNEPFPVSAAFPVVNPAQREEVLPAPMQQRQMQVRSRTEGSSAGGGSLVVSIAKLADQIIVREEGDIDRIGEAVARKVIQAIKNMPRPA